MDFNNILLQKKDGVAKMTINRPPLNILNIETIEEMNRALVPWLDTWPAQLAVWGKSWSLDSLSQDPFSRDPGRTSLSWIHLPEVVMCEHTPSS